MARPSSPADRLFRADHDTVSTTITQARIDAQIQQPIALSGWASLVGHVGLKLGAEVPQLPSGPALGRTAQAHTERFCAHARQDVRSSPDRRPGTLPSLIRVSRPSITLVPIRQGGHLPQDSSTQKASMNFASMTMQVRSSDHEVHLIPWRRPVPPANRNRIGVSRCASSDIHPRARRSRRP